MKKVLRIPLKMMTYEGLFCTQVTHGTHKHKVTVKGKNESFVLTPTLVSSPRACRTRGRNLASIILILRTLESRYLEKAINFFPRRILLFFGAHSIFTPSFV